MDCLSHFPSFISTPWLRPSMHQLCHGLYSCNHHHLCFPPHVNTTTSSLFFCKCVTVCVSLDVSGESSQSGAQFPGRPSEVWSQWQNQHHSQQTGEQHTHPNPSQTEVFQVTHCCCPVYTHMWCDVTFENSCMSSPHPRLCISAGHVTHGWRSHPGNCQLQHWGLRWPRHVPPLLWVTPPVIELDWCLHWSLMLYLIFLCCWFYTLSWLAAGECLQFIDTHTHTSSTLRGTSLSDGRRCISRVSFLSSLQSAAAWAEQSFSSTSETTHPFLVILLVCDSGKHPAGNLTQIFTVSSTVLYLHIDPLWLCRKATSP